jgi:hypothetical protein
VPTPLEQLRPELAWEHSGMEAIVMRLLAREREQRFPSAAAVLEVLSMPPPAPRHVTVAEEPPALVAESGPTVERSRSPVWFIAAILMAICLGIWSGVRFLPPLLVTAAPVLTPAEGTYAEARPVTITDTTPFAVIYYTVDDSPPTDKSPIYKQPITGLPSGSMIRAMAKAFGCTPSSEVSGVYLWTGAPLLKAKPPEPSAYDQGKAAYDNKDFEQAKTLFTQACGSGETKACNDLGYIQGKAAYDSKQYDQARTLFTPACEGGNMNACNYLGVLYGQGLGGKPDADKAHELFQKACEQGYLSSCASLGIMSQDSGNKSEARKYFQKACDESQVEKVKTEACELLRGVQ